MSVIHANDPAALESFILKKERKTKAATFMETLPEMEMNCYTFEYYRLFSLSLHIILKLSLERYFIDPQYQDKKLYNFKDCIILFVIFKLKYFIVVPL